MRIWMSVQSFPVIFRTEHSQLIGPNRYETHLVYNKRACSDNSVCICWRKRSPGDICVHKYGYQAPDRTPLHIQMCLDWPWQFTKRQTSSDSVPFHAPASYYLTAPLTLRALYFPSIHFYNPSFPREQAHHQSWRFSQGTIRMHIKYIDVLFCNFSFVTSVFRRTWRKLIPANV